MATFSEEALQNLTFKHADGDAKLREMILYLAEKCRNDDTFGSTKLNKLLYFSDFLAYAHFGKPITGAEYMGLPQGPVPRSLLRVRTDLEAEGKLAIRKRQFHGFEQHKLIPLADADLEAFSGREIALVDEVVDSFRNTTAKSISLASHNRVWRIAGSDRNPIPYEAVFISDDPVDDDDIRRTAELAREHGWEGVAA